MSAPAVELVVFTCVGREHLLERTMRSFERSVHGTFSRRRVVVDGPMNEAALVCVRPDSIIKHVERGGYVRSIGAALRQIEAEYFFWLEDDWQFVCPVDLAGLLAQMRARPELAQIRLNKTGPLTADEKRIPLGEDVYLSTVGFSANPCLCRTAHMRQAFEALLARQAEPSAACLNWEDMFSHACEERGLRCAALDSAGVRHLGYLESTGREWHMSGTLRERPRQFVPVIGGSRPLWRRVWMLAKFLRRGASLALGMLYDDEAYDIVFRVVTLPSTRRSSRVSRRDASITIASDPDQPDVHRVSA